MSLSALEREGILTRSTPWTNLEDVMLREDEPCMIPTGVIKVRDTDGWASGAGEEKWGVVFNGDRVSVLGKWKSAGDGW